MSEWTKEQQEQAKELLKDSAVMLEAAGTIAVEYVEFHQQANKHIEKIEKFLEQAA